MAIDFPNSPTAGDLYTAGGKTWQWNSTFWAAYGTSPVLRTSDTAPVSPNNGDLWYETDTGRFFTYIDSAWVEIGNATDIEIGALQPNQITSLTATTSLTNDDVFALVDNPSSAVVVSKATLGVLAQFMTPAGTIQDYVGSTAPSGWSLLDGSTITSASTTYPNLWAVAPVGWRSGSSLILPDARGRVIVAKSSSGTFQTLGGTGGAETHTLTSAEIPSVAAANHTHGAGTFAASDHGHGPGSFAAAIGATNGDAYRIGYVAGTVNGPGTATYSVQGGGLLVNSGGFNHYTPVFGTSAGATPAVTGNSGTTSANTGSGGAHNNLQPFIVMNKIIRLG